MNRLSDRTCGNNCPGKKAQNSIVLDLYDYINPQKLFFTVICIATNRITISENALFEVTIYHKQGEQKLLA